MSKEMKFMALPSKILTLLSTQDYILNRITQFNYLYLDASNKHYMSH